MESSKAASPREQLAKHNDPHLPRPHNIIGAVPSMRPGDDGLSPGDNLDPSRSRFGSSGPRRGQLDDERGEARSSVLGFHAERSC